jgi:nucleoside triphosphate pyrophosphatase
MRPRALILASASPRRQSLLAEAGISFTVHPADLDEKSFEKPGVMPAELAQQLAIAKANAVAQIYPDHLVLGADTVVGLGREILGKPEDEPHALRMLTSLSGSTHQVITGVALVCRRDNYYAAECVISTVQMRPLSPREIADYVATQAWRGKAGGYGLQDNDAFVVCISGCPTNVVGLPMTTTQSMLAAAINA